MFGVKAKKRLLSAVVGMAMTATALVVPFISGNKIVSTDVNAATTINYAKALQYSLYFYDANMCGDDVEDDCALDWRGNCHTCDSAVKTDYGTLDLSGGYHDAGDHVKFNLPAAYSATMLGWGYYEFKDAYTKTGQDGHLKTITDRFSTYFKKCTVLDSSGNVKAYCYQVGDGDSDHGYWGAPEKQTTSRPVYFATSSNPGTDIVCETAASLAVNYLNFGNKEDLDYAKALFKFAKSNSKSCATQGCSAFYSTDTWMDDYCMAAIWLYKATKDSSYKTDCESMITQSNYQYTSTWPVCWGNVWPAVNVVREDWSRANEVLNQFTNNDKTSQGYVCKDQWGSARYNTAMQLMGMVYDKHNSSTKYTTWSEGQMSYLMGNNNNNKCYMVGYDTNSASHPHHRASSGLSEFPVTNDTRKQAHVLVGALVGGPGKSDEFVDATDDYHYNEVALDYNAGFVGALASLYLKYGSGQSVASSVPGVSGSTNPVNPVTTPAETTTKETTATTPKQTTATTPKQTTATTPKQTTDTSTGGNSGVGNKTVKVNATLDYNSTSNKEFSINLADYINPGDKINSISYEVSASGNIGNFNGGFGMSVVANSPVGSNYWYSMDSFNKTLSGTTATIKIDIPDNVKDYVDINGIAKLGVWWSEQQKINITSVTVNYSSDSVQETQPPVETTVTTVTTPKTTTATTPKTTTTTTTTTEEVPSNVEYGNVNGDAKVNILDVAEFCKIIGAGGTFATAQQRANADCVKDGNLDMKDALALLQFITKTINKLPA